MIQSTNAMSTTEAADMVAVEVAKGSFVAHVISQ